MEDALEKVVSSFASTEEAPRLELKHAFYSIFDTQSIFFDRRKRSYLALASPALYLLNMISLVMPTKAAMRHYNESLWFFETLSNLRFDGLSWNYGFEYVLSILTYIFIFAAAGATVILTYIQYAKLKVNFKLKTIIRSVFVVPLLKGFKEAFLVPVSCMLLSTIKYGFTDSTPSEYVYTHPKTLSLLHALFGIIALPIFIIEVWVSIRTLYDASFNNAQQQWFARSHSYVQNRVFLVVLAQCTFLYTHDTSSPQMYLVFCSLVHTYLAYLHCAYLPYYNDLTNSIYSGIYIYLASCAVSSIITIHTQSANVIVLTSIFMFPCYLIISHGIVQKRSHILEGKRVKDCRSPYDYMPVLKQKLAKLEGDCSDHARERISNELKQALNDLCSKFPNFRITNLWESLFYFFIEKNPSLAQLKLCKHGMSGTFESQFLFFHISKFYDGLINSEDVAYLNWLRQIAQVKEDDRKLCGQLVRIYDMLLACGNDANAIQDKVIPTYKLLLKTKNTYKRLTQVYTKRPEVLDLFGHFMCDLLNDNTGSQFLSFGQTEKNSRSRQFVPINRITSLFNADVGIIVVAGSIEDVGSILYSNEEAARLLGLTSNQMVGLELNQFIPPPYSNNHNSKLIEFLELGSANRIFRSHLVLYSQDRYDVEVTYEVKVLALNCKPYFLTAVRGKPGNRDLAIYDTKGQITSCTRNFERLYGTGSRVEGINLESLFPGIWEKRSEYPDFVPFIHTVEEVPLIMIFTHAMLRLSKIQFVYVLRSSDALEELMEDKNVDPKYGPWIETVKDHLTGRSRKVARSSGVLSEMIKKVFFHEHKSVEEHHTLDSQAIHDTELNITSLSSAQSEVRMDKFRKLRDDTILKAKRIKLILAVAFVIVIGIMIGMLVALNYFLGMIVEVDTIDKIGSRRIHVVEIANAARKLELIDFEKFAGDRASIVNDLEDTIAALSDAENQAEETRTSGHHLGKDEIVPVWKWEPNITLNLVTGREAVRLMLSNAEELTSSTVEKAVLYTMRNGMGETLSFLNKTVYEYVEQETNVRYDLILLVAVLMSSGLVCILVAYIGILAPNIYFIETTSRKVYENLKALPKESVMESRLKALDRLEMVHGEENTSIGREKLKATEYKLVWPKLALKFGLFVSATLLIMLASFLVYKAELESIVLKNNNYSVWAGTRSFALLEAFFWAREYYLSKGSKGYLEILQEQSMYYSYEERLSNTTSTLNWAHKLIMFDLNDIGKDFTYESSHTVETLYDSYDSSSIDLDYGVHSGVIEFFNKISYFQINPSEGGLQELELVTENLLVAMEELSDQHQDYVSELVQKTRVTLIMILLSYGVILVFLYLYYAQVIKHTSTYIIAIARLLPLMPDAR
eukprot:CAMPEP_0204910408 /NCGR_PEP_ID=MMETSP1397-20131031/8945_1 /ASSEMBLY_ACC=CAM_ASM_000891 /TAXON_ID=49980 /ORGANISM="Climacostomum Climacostomum virens, Strain Stock W-24" /LENGTH=1366 /DNA_ID=CAMNT_0052080567 /DNA_START=94 /DNA_END=4191 /DNA_ORIENTATION=-